MDSLIAFLKATAWPMERPKSYGTFHLTFFFVGLVVCILLVYLLKNKNDKVFRGVMLACGLFLLISEVYKQLFYTFVIGEGHYQWWIFPFQLCSIPMYLCIIVGLIKECRIRSLLCNFMVAFNLMGGFIAFLEPSGLTHEYVTLTWHAFIWHMMIVFVGIYIAVSGRGAKKLTDFKKSAFMYILLCLIAFSINLALYKVSDATVNMFWVGPVNSPIIVFKDIAKDYGWYVNTPIYMICVLIAGFAFYLPFALYNSKKNKKVNI